MKIQQVLESTNLTPEQVMEGLIHKLKRTSSVKIDKTHTTIVFPNTSMYLLRYIKAYLTRFGLRAVTADENYRFRHELGWITGDVTGSTELLYVVEFDNSTTVIDIVKDVYPNELQVTLDSSDMVADIFL